MLLFGWGAISFHNLPVEAYPDVANNYVTVITQWPGRAAEEVEQQVTVPLEIGMAGIPHMTHLRSTTLAGLSSVTMIFDDESDNDWNREKVLERLSQVTLPTGLQPQIGTDWSPVGQIYWYTLSSTNPASTRCSSRASRTGSSKSSSAACPASSTSPASAASPASTRSSSTPKS